MKDFLEGAAYGLMFTTFFTLVTIIVLTIIY